MRKVDKVFQAAETGDIETLHNLLKPNRKGVVKFPGPDVATEDGWSMLMAAASNGHADVVSFLLESGANIGTQSHDGTTALMATAHSGHRDIAEILMDRGADVNTKAPNGCTALMLAAQFNHGDVAKLLADRGADIHYIMTGENHGWNALFAASAEGHTELTKWLIEKGADISSRCISGWTPIMYAARDGHIEIVKLLISKGADINCGRSDGWSPLSLAVFNDYIDIARLLIKNGADVNKRNNKGESVLETAVKKKNGTITILLIKSGADVTIATKGGSSVLHRVVSAGMVNAVSFILKTGKANINSADKNGITPLMRASRSNSVEIINLLLSFGTDVSLTDNEGRTALDIAYRKKKIKAATRLEQAGAVRGEASLGSHRDSVEKGQLHDITSLLSSIQLIDSSSITPSGSGGTYFQEAIQCSNNRDSSGAARNFQKALDTGLDDLRAGYAYANIGTIRLMNGNVASAVDCFNKIFAMKQVLYESAHDAAQYMSIIYSELGRTEEAAFLESLAGQTQSYLGYALDPGIADEVRVIVGQNKNQLS